jgi:carboxyl-terminal processing protease
MSLKAIRFLLGFLLVLLVSAPVWAVTQPAEQVTFKPSLEQRLRSNLATKFLANWHYKETRLDDELSVKIFDGYLELLDPGYSFFLASDIETFAPYRLHRTTHCSIPIRHPPMRCSTCTLSA